MTTKPKTQNTLSVVTDSVEPGMEQNAEQNVDQNVDQKESLERQDQNID